MKHKVFALKNLTVKNDYITCLDMFNMHVCQGQILGILCNDIYEKTALLDVFEGSYPLTSKNVYFDYTGPGKMNSTRLFRKYFAVIGTEPKVLPSFSVIDNILLTPDHPEMIMNLAKTRAMAESLLEEFHLELPLDCPSDALTAAQKYMIGVLNAFVRKKKIIVLTNLNDRMNTAEYADFLMLVQDMIDRGLTFLVIIDTPEKTLTGITDELLIVSNGRDIAQINSDIFHFSELYNYMLTGSIDTPAIHVHRSPEEIFPVNEDDFDTDEPALFEHVRTALLKDLDFSVYPGELIKIICTDQNSIQAVSKLINGTTPQTGGHIRIRNRNAHFYDLKEAVSQGIYWCPNGPYANLLLDNLSVLDNLLLGPLTKAGKIRISPGIRENMTEYCRKYFPLMDPNLPVREFDKTTRQKLAFHKILLQAPKLVFIEKPFEETILGMNEITIRMIEELKRRGTAVVILSMSMSDAGMLDGETLYMRNGEMIDELELYRQMY